MIMKITNAVTVGLLLLGGLSFLEIVTAVLGITALILAIIINIVSYGVKKSERKKNEAETLLAKEQLRRLEKEK